MESKLFFFLREQTWPPRWFRHRHRHRHRQRCSIIISLTYFEPLPHDNDHPGKGEVRQLRGGFAPTKIQSLAASPHHWICPHGNDDDVALTKTTKIIMRWSWFMESIKIMIMNMIWQARGLMDRGMLGSVLDCTIAYPDRYKYIVLHCIKPRLIRTLKILFADTDFLIF